MPTRVILHGVKERFLQRTCEGLLCPKFIVTDDKQQFGGLKPALQRSLAGEKYFLVSFACLLLTFAAINASVLPCVSWPHLTLRPSSQVSDVVHCRAVIFLVSDL